MLKCLKFICLTTYRESLHGQQCRGYLISCILTAVPSGDRMVQPKSGLSGPVTFKIWTGLIPSDLVTQCWAITRFTPHCFVKNATHLTAPVQKRCETVRTGLVHNQELDWFELQFLACLSIQTDMNEEVQHRQWNTASTVNILQKVQNAAARLICNLKPCEPVTASLKQLHWLPVKQ